MKLLVFGVASSSWPRLLEGITYCDGELEINKLINLEISHHALLCHKLEPVFKDGPSTISVLDLNPYSMKYIDSHQNYDEA